MSRDDDLHDAMNEDPKSDFRGTAGATTSQRDVAAPDKLEVMKYAVPSTPPPTWPSSLDTRGLDTPDYSCSVHTEIEYYSTGETEGEEEDCDENDEDYEDEEVEDDDEEGDSDENDSDDESSNADFRCTALQRAASRQSIHSYGSEGAFSLPVGNQDDVSSLGGNISHIEDVDDISLKEDEEVKQERKSNVLPVRMVTSKSPKSSLESARRRSLRDSIEKNRNMLSIQFSRVDSALDLPATVEEGEHDDEEDHSIKADEVLLPRGQVGDEGLRHGDVDAVARRMHASLFLPQNGSLLPSTSNVVDSQNVQCHGSPKLDHKKHGIELPTFNELVKSLPPELDWNEAKKYILQLAEGVPESPSPTKRKQRNLPTSAAKSAGLESEYTEVTVHEDEFMPLKDGPVTIPKCCNRRPVSAHQTQESATSYDFTEILEEWEEEEVIEEEVNSDTIGVQEVGQEIAT